MIQCRETRCHWAKQGQNLVSTTFDISCLKIEDIVNEFGGERKGSKSDTLLDGLTKSANKNLAERFVGQKVMLSRSPKCLYLTNLSLDILKQVPLPPEIEALFTTPTTPAANPVKSTDLAAVFGKASTPVPTNVNINEERKLAYQSKEFFRQLAGHLKLTHVNQAGDIFTYVVTKDLSINDGVLNSILNGGEPISINGKERELVITFGFQKPITTL